MRGALLKDNKRALLARKGLHVLLVAAIALTYFLSRPLALWLCVAAFLVIGALRTHPYLERVRTLHLGSFGDLLLPVGLFILILLAPHAAVPTLAVPFVVIGIADPLATLVGTQYGRHRFRVFGEWRSVEGSAVFALVSACALFLSTGSLIGACAGAIALTLIEALSLRGSDNLTLPIAAAYLSTIF